MTCSSGIVKFSDEVCIPATILDTEDKTDLASSSAEKVHYLPFQIEHDGKFENVDSRFHGTGFEDKNSTNVIQNYFRGRSIQAGSEPIVLKDYEGLLAVEQQQPKEEELIVSSLIRPVDGNTDKDSMKEKKLAITTKFNKFTYWNWDQLPTKMDAPVKLLDWLELAQVLHEPIETDEDST